jgi:hypothetical protein
MKNKIFTMLMGMLIMTFAANGQQKSMTERHPLDQKVTVVGKSEIHQIFRAAPKTAIFSEDFEGGTIPTGWATQNGDSEWIVSNDNSSQYWVIPPHTFYASINDDAAGETGDNSDTYLATPSIDLTSAANPMLNFEALPDATYGGIHKVMVSTNGGTSWTDLLTLTASPAWGNYEIDLSAYAGESDVMLAFHYNDDGEWATGFAIDDVVVSELGQNDLGVVMTLPNFLMGGDDVYPVVIVGNMGLNTQNDFDVEVVIEDETKAVVYSDSKSVSGAGLAAGEEMEVAMDNPWMEPAAGTYTITGTVTLVGDENPENDVLTRSLDVVNMFYNSGYSYGYDAFGSYTDQIVRTDLTLGNLVPLGAATTNDFLIAGDYVFDVIAGVEVNSNDIYIINGDGAAYKMGTVSGAGTILGMAFDQDNEIIYANDADGYLYTIDEDNLSATVVGDIGYICYGIAYLDGVLYGLDGANADLISIDPVTGAGSVIGNTGLNLNYAQDIGSDRTNNVLYGTLYTEAKAGGGLYSIDVTTGAATLVNEFVDEVTMCAIPGYSGYDVTFNVKNEDDDPIENALIDIYNFHLYTDANGIAVITLADDYTYDYTVTADGYITQEGTVVVSGAPVVENVVMPVELYNMTFNVDMSEAIAGGIFDPGADVLYVGGSMNGWAEPGTDPTMQMYDPDSDETYTLQIALAPGSYEFKYFKNSGWFGGEWAGDPNRTFEIIDEDVERFDVWGVYVGMEDAITVETSVYPNPSNGIIQVSSNQPGYVKVMDITGHMVFSGEIHSELKVDLTNQSEGMYLIQVETNGHVSNHKIIVK